MNEDIIKKYIPTFIFHKNENYYPVSLPYYINNCQLYYDKTLLADYGEVNLENLSNFTVKLPTGETIKSTDTIHNKWHLNIKEESYPGTNPELLDEIPIYIYYKTVYEKGICYYEINYIVIYMYNGSYNIYCTPITAGSHQADIEHITIRLFKDTLEFKDIYYARHGYNEGEWKSDIDLENFKVYVAKHGHGHFKKSGKHYRICFAVKDECNDGIYWKPTKYIIYNFVPKEKLKWTDYIGKYGNTGVDGIKQQKWWVKESSKSKSFIENLLCCCKK